MTFLNSQFYTTPYDILFNTLDLNYLDTAMATAGCTINGTQWVGANSLKIAQDTYAAGGYVLVVEGAVPTGAPLGGAAGEFCEIGSLTAPNANGTMLYNVRALAANALAILCVGTCSSFGGIPAARGNLTTAKSVYDSLTSTTDKAKVINIPGCPPHPDWIVGTISHIVSTNITLPQLDRYRRPVEQGYGEYQCNAGPCPWRFNNTQKRANNSNNSLISEPDYNNRYPIEGNSRALGKFKWTRTSPPDVGCLGILGCKGRKTKADCSRRRWNTDVAEEYGVNWCVGSRGNCQGCTDPGFPDRVGKFYTFK